MLKAGGPGAIEANIAKISGLIKNGNFIADSFNERPAFELGVSLFTFTQDSDGNKILTLEKVNGGFPNFVLNQTDPESGKISSIKISSLDKRSLVMDKFTISTDAKGKAVFEATGMKAGGMTVKYTTEEKKGSKTTVSATMDPEALNADKVTLTRNPKEESMEMVITGFRGGKIKANIAGAATGGKPTQINIDLPDADQVTIAAVKIKINKEGVTSVVLDRPTIRKFKSFIPGEITGDFTSILCDLSINGELEVGHGNFDKLTLTSPFDTIVARVPDNVPVVSVTCN